MIRLKPSVQALDTSWVSDHNGRPPGLDGLNEPGRVGHVGVDRGLVEVGQPPPDLRRLTLFQQQPKSLLHAPRGDRRMGRPVARRAGPPEADHARQVRRHRGQAHQAEVRIHAAQQDHLRRVGLGVRAHEPEGREAEPRLRALRAPRDVPDHGARREGRSHRPQPGGGDQAAPVAKGGETLPDPRPGVRSGRCSRTVSHPRSRRTVPGHDLAPGPHRPEVGRGVGPEGQASGPAAPANHRGRDAGGDRRPSAHQHPEEPTGAPGADPRLAGRGTGRCGRRNRPQTTSSSPPGTASRSAISISGETSST